MAGRQRFVGSGTADGEFRSDLRTRGLIDRQIEIGVAKILLVSKARHPSSPAIHSSS